MSLRELVVLGTASQIPTRERAHNACFLRWDERGILLDPGEGTQRQLTLAGIPVSAIHAILVTHFHGDHVLGLGSIFQRLSLDGVPHEVEVFYPGTGQPYFERQLESSQYRRTARIRPRPLPLEGARHGTHGLTLTALPLEHSVDALGYRLEEPDERRFLPERLAEVGLAGPAVGTLQREGRIRHRGRTFTVEELSVVQPGAVFAFLMDTRRAPSCLALARGADLLVSEATYLDEDAELAREHYHLTAAQAGRIAREAGARSLVLTHFSQRYRDIEPFALEARREFPAAQVARDLDRFPFPRPQRGEPGA